jgi:hypothetical protein
MWLDHDLHRMRGQHQNRMHRKPRHMCIARVLDHNLHDHGTMRFQRVLRCRHVLFDRHGPEHEDLRCRNLEGMRTS